MTYCRFSSENFSCDVYAYEDVSGCYVTHVAASRYELEIAVPPAESISDVEACLARELAFHAAIVKADKVPIGLEFDGKTFVDPTLDALLQRLTGLRDAGYRVPGSVFELLASELSET